MNEPRFRGRRRAALTLAVAGALAVAACKAPDDEPGSTAGEVAAVADPAKAVDEVTTSPGKPTAPIKIQYSVVGEPVVGQPVAVNLEVSSSLRDRPIDLHYRINDARDLSFPQAQPQRVSLGALGDSGRVRQQVTVVPRRGGRLYLNVSAEIETPGGTMIKAMAIPIQTHDAPDQLPSNGELSEDADGEPIVTMPAEETTR